jgi:hypothetical protein
MGKIADIADTGPALIPDPKISDDLSVTRMTMSRWDEDPRMAALGWPEVIYIGRRKYRDAKKYAEFKARLARKAIERRSALLKSSITESSSKQTA